VSGSHEVLSALSGVKSVSFDLDGTLVDTCEDLTAACNQTLIELGVPALSSGIIRSYIGHGVSDLLSRCVLGHQLTMDEALCLEKFNAFYAQVNGKFSTLYPRVRESLELLRGAGMVLSCVTNKPASFTLPLLARFDLLQYFETVVAGDTLTNMKPHPAPLFHACHRAGSRPAQHVHVGDSYLDISAARAAGCGIFCVTYGYQMGRPIQREDCDGLFFNLWSLATQLAMPLLGACL
jgi:phosphoglycolate phosphatase